MLLPTGVTLFQTLIFLPILRYLLLYLLPADIHLLSEAITSTIGALEAETTATNNSIHLLPRTPD